MSRRTVEEITDDVTGQKFYAADDSSTTVPFTYVNADGESVNVDVSPATKSAIYAMLAGNLTPVTDLVLSLRPKTERASITDEKRNDVAAWWANAHNGGTLPGRVTTQMIEKYDTHIRAQEAARAADAANADNADSTPATSTPPSRQSRRNAAAGAANAAANGEVPANA